MAVRPAPGFVGRARERKTIDDMLDRTRAGESAVLVMRGEAGIGKTALMRYCARQASGCRVAQVAGVASELNMPFAALHQLCLPLLGEVTALPEPQEQALRVAFGLAAGSSPDRFMVGLAVLGLLAEVAEKRPLVCLVDDAQWLDEPSCHVLGFVGRRLLAEATLLLIAVREAGDDRIFSALPTMTLEGLADQDARALLAGAVPGHLDEQVRDRIVAETRGNPLGLLELPHGLSPAELAGGFGVHAATLPGRIEDHYTRRVTALPEPTQQLMLLAAADPTGDATLLWGAAEALGLPRTAAAAAQSEQLLEIGTRVSFRHPLVRSAVYAAASAENCRAVHLALAAATDVEQEPERRVWHLAAAATGPDEDVAAQLERTAHTAQARAGLAAAAAFLHRAVALTTDPARRADRALSAAEAYLHAGGFDAARGLLAEAAAVAGDDLQLARVEQLKGQVEAASKPGREAPVRLLQAARRLESLDVGLARNTYLQAWWAALLAGQFAAPGGDLLEVSTAVLSAPRLTEPRPCDLLLDGLARVIAVGRAAAAPSLRLAVDLFLADQVSADDWIQWGRSATTAAFLLWDFESWAQLSNRQVALARESGALASLVISLNFHGLMVMCRGELEQAAALVAEQDAVKEVTGIRIAAYGARLIEANRGRLMDQSPQMSAIDREFIEHGDDGYALKVANLGRAILNNSLGRHAEAFAAVRDVAFEITCLETWALSELIEAAVRSGREEAAHEALQQLLAVTVEGSDWAAGVEARGRALVSAAEVAEHWYGESIACLARTPLRSELARSHLVYGEWLGREGRRVEARRQLGAAYEMFAAMGSESFAERARRELLAAGEKVRKRVVNTQHELTPQEEHIARLARDGSSNGEIGAELFISGRTVEWHLRKVFFKLGITSRKELSRALPSRVGTNTTSFQEA